MLGKTFAAAAISFPPCLRRTFRKRLLLNTRPFRLCSTSVHTIDLPLSWRMGSSPTAHLPGQWNEKRVFAVESFTRESFIIHRTDYGSYPLTATYIGLMSDDGNSVSGY